MEIIEKKEHSLLLRTEIIAKDSYTGATPSRGSIKDRLANTLKANKELLVIKHIYPDFGFGTAKIIAHLYSNKKDMERIEPEYAFKKGVSKKEGEKKETKPETNKKEVKPEQSKEEKKEEKPVEQKKQDESKPEEKKPEQKQEGKRTII